MNRLLTIPLVCVFLALSSGQASAIHKCGNRCVQCPRCQGCCKLDVSESKEKKHYWSVETEQICVPRFVFPWQNRSLSSHGAARCGCAGGCSGGCSGGGCAAAGCSGGCGGSQCNKRVNHNGARVITVCRMKKNSYECPSCSYKWSVEDGSGGCSANCSCGSCESGGESSDAAPEDAPPPPETDFDAPEAGDQPAPVEPSLSTDPTEAPIEAEVPVEAPVETPLPEAPKDLQVVPESSHSLRLLPRPGQRVAAPNPIEAEAKATVDLPPEPTFSIVDPFSGRSVFGRSTSIQQVSGSKP